MIVGLMIVAVLYALPNLYGEEPAVQIAPSARTGVVGESLQKRVTGVLDEAKLTYTRLERDETRMVIRFADTELQLKARDLIADELGRQYAVALNLVPNTPDWLQAIGALPMYLGLDLRGGVYFLMQVDMQAAMRLGEERYRSDIRSTLRDNKIRYLAVTRKAPTETHPGGVEVKVRDAESAEKARDAVRGQYRDLQLDIEERDGSHYLVASIGEQERRETRQFAVQQNLATLRNRVNELGVAEPVIQQQGEDRIVVQLPGVQDPVRAREILGATATLEYHAQDVEHDIQDALNGKVPAGSRIYHDRENRPLLLKKQIIVTGDQVIDASSGFDQSSGSPAVFVTLNDKGARKMHKFTKENVGKPMAVVYIETKVSTISNEQGEPIKKRERIEQVISVANVLEPFSKRFQTTGLDNPEESRDLALLLRAGALAAPMEIVEERTIGPSLGQDNIDQGRLSVIIGFACVLGFMLLWYRGFGLVANIALAVNLVFIVALLSMLQATLTLPGIAGIVLTVGMAVDANVLIFERIREELRNGNSPQASISAGYDKALSTIADANITTLIAAVVLFTFGTGPIKGFAVTLSLGIATSMFTAIMGTRAIVNSVWGGRRLGKLSI